MATKLKKAPRWKVAVEVTSGGIKLGLKIFTYEQWRLLGKTMLQNKKTFRR
jgi:hypothetical protein